MTAQPPPPASAPAPAPAPPPAPPADWSPDHLRLHRQLRRRPGLLPAGEPLLLAVSGGQDSMALVGLLADLQRLYGWTLQLWHGDHGWRADSGQQALELAAWAGQRGLPISLDRWQPTAGGRPSEAEARRWRYGRLVQRAEALGAQRVVTGHTATDRAETLLFNLARGSHRRGLASLRRQRPLTGPITLVRPLLDFRRQDTTRLCRQLNLPVWLDPTNAEPRYSRNRLRHEVLPVLEALHPGAERRLAQLADQLGDEEEAARELLELALGRLEGEGTAAPGGAPSLKRCCLLRLARANQAALLQHWLEQHTGRRLERRPLEALLDRLPPERGPGRVDLADGWRLGWQRTTLWLSRTADRHADDQHP